MAGFVQAASAAQLSYGAALSSRFQVAESRSSVGPSALVLCGGCGVRCASRRFVRANSSSGRGASGRGASGDASSTKPKQSSILCKSCDGNGAVACSQCEGGGLNTKDHFDGRFKAGATCWLCRGKRQMLCGNCNGAGFMGGFMNTQDE